MQHTTIPHTLHHTITPRDTTAHLSLLVIALLHSPDRFIQSGGRPSLPPDLEPDSWFSALYRLCWQQDPQDRPTFETIVATLAPEIAVVLEQMEVELGKAGTGPPSPGDQSRNNSYTSISAASFANALQRSWSTNMSDMTSPQSEDMKTPLLP